MFVLEANKTQLSLIQRELITSGSVNVYSARFTFSDDWDGLARTAIFRAGAESRSVPLSDDNVAVIPWEVLRKPHVHLSCGVYGTKDGDTVLPTIWEDMGNIWQGAEPSGEEAQPPTPDVWEQRLDAKADGLEYDGVNLSLMAGQKILNIVQIAGNGGQAIPVPGKDGTTFVPHVSEDGELTWTNDGGLENPGPVDIRGPEGEGVPDNGEAGQILVKRSETPYDIAWGNNTADNVGYTPGDGIDISARTVKGAIDELFTSVSSGKEMIASAITDKGVQTDANMSFEAMAGHIGQIESGGLPDDVYTIDLKAEPENAGIVSGGGYASDGMAVAVKAEAKKDGYFFEGWTENGSRISSSNPYSFVVGSDRNLTANFIYGITGITWTQVLSSGDWRSVAYGKGRFVACDAVGSLAYSNDGINWIQKTLSLYHTLCYGDGRFIGLSWNTTSAIYSDDGINWKNSTIPSSTWSGIAYGNGRFIAVSTNGKAIYSDDSGETWKTIDNIPAGSYYSLAYEDGLFIAPNNSTPAFVAYSDDGGETWKRTETSSVLFSWPDITYGNGRFIAVSNNSTPQIKYSDDGKTWTEVSVPSGGWIGVAYGDGAFVAVCNKNTTNVAMFSNNGGETWEISSAPTAVSLQKIAYGNNKFVAVGKPGILLGYPQYGSPKSTARQKQSNVNFEMNADIDSSYDDPATFTLDNEVY